MRALSARERYWRVVNRPSRYFSLGFLTVGGFIAGIVFWGGFNTALELTNTETFCTGCHEMRDNVFAELQAHDPLHQPLRRARDVPRLPRAARLDRQDRAQDAGVEGSLGQDLRHHQHAREVRRRMRLELAQHEWARLKANDSLECRNCHDFDYMDFTRQSPRAAQHALDAASRSGEKTCIDCHKGIAHRLPDMGVALRSP